MIRPLSLLAALLAGIVLAGIAAAETPAPKPAEVPAQAPPWKGKQVIDDPEWQKRFLGSYGFLSGAEPPVNDGELEVLREVIALMRANPRAAAAVLQQKAGTSSSAALDFVLANLNFQNGDLDAGGEALRERDRRSTRTSAAPTRTWACWVQRGEYEKALEHLTRGHRAGRPDGRSYGLLGFQPPEPGENVAAEAAYGNAILQEPDTRDWKLGLARSLLAMERTGGGGALRPA
jgi:tetratricopeptide (TPR) repeat protein